MDMIRILGEKMADRQAELSFRKACAGMKGAQATIRGIGQRIRSRTITEEDEGVIRWTISGMQNWQLAALLGWGAIHADDLEWAYAQAARKCGVRPGCLKLKERQWCGEDGWTIPQGMAFCKRREEIPERVMEMEAEGKRSGRFDEEEVSWYEVLPGLKIGVGDDVWGMGSARARP